MWRAFGIMLAGLVLLAGFVFGAVMLEDRAAEFEARGTPVPGVVVGMHGGFRQSWTADVRYRLGNVEKEGTIQIDSNPTFKAGDPVTVIYDPSDPERIAAPGFPNDPTGAVLVMSLALLAGMSTFIVGLVRLVRGLFTRPGHHARPPSGASGDFDSPETTNPPGHTWVLRVVATPELLQGLRCLRSGRIARRRA